MPQQFDLKFCAGKYGCGEWKPLSDFPTNRANRDGHQSPCRPCRNLKNRVYRADPEKAAAHLVRQRAYYAAAPEAKRAKNRAYAASPQGRRASYGRHLKYRYGITRDDWDAMLIKQRGRCAICAYPMLVPFVDHNHRTNTVRELLCVGCNARVGAIESPLFDATLAYIDRNRDIHPQDT